MCVTHLYQGLDQKTKDLPSVWTLTDNLLEEPGSEAAWSRRFIVVDFDFGLDILSLASEAASSSSEVS